MTTRLTHKFGLALTVGFVAISTHCDYLDDSRCGSRKVGNMKTAEYLGLQDFTVWIRRLNEECGVLLPYWPDPPKIVIGVAWPNNTRLPILFVPETPNELCNTTRATPKKLWFCRLDRNLFLDEVRLIDV